MAIPAHMYPWFVMEKENPYGLKPQEKEELIPQKDMFSYQRDEIDLLIHAQNERLRMVLQEQRRKETALVMKKYEFFIRLKDEEVLKAINRNTELQTHVRRMEMEVQKWQRLAEENESAIASLTSTIERLREAEDAESFCVEEERERESERKMVCRKCNCRKSCVVMLPCRHLCSCKDCDGFLDSCPVCNEVKKFSIEVLD